MLKHFAITALLMAAVCEAIAAQQPEGNAPPSPLAITLSQVIRDAIPLEFDKQQDWGATREITVGYAVDGKPFHYHLRERKKAVEHGVWKHYRLRMIEPERNLNVRLADMHALQPGRIAFTLLLDAKLEAWCRAKTYQYGVHLGAFEVEGDMRLHVEVHGEVAITATTANGALAFAAQPVVRDAKLSLEELHVRRVSNARGPIVRELCEGAAGIIEDELNGPRLTEKLNGAIEKKRDRLMFAPADFAGLTTQ
jgi:hypothetical protein